MRALLILLLLAPPLAAQTARPAWTASARQSAEAFDDGRAAWLISEVAAERRLARGAVIVGVGRAERYDQAAPFGVVDVYADLLPRLYGNARVLVAPGAETVVRRDLMTELYLVAGDRLELSAGARRIDYAAGGATLLLGSATLFRPQGRLRARVSATPTDSVTAVSGSLTARLDLGRGAERSRSYVELRGGRGQEVVAAPDGTVSVRTSWDIGLGGTVRVGRRATLGASLGRVRDAGLSRTGLEARVSVDL